jgi:hypothetical protein
MIQSNGGRITYPTQLERSLEINSEHSDHNSIVMGTSVDKLLEDTHFIWFAIVFTTPYYPIVSVPVLNAHTHTHTHTHTRTAL